MDSKGSCSGAAPIDHHFHSLLGVVQGERERDKTSPDVVEHQRRSYMLGGLFCLPFFFRYLARLTRRDSGVSTSLKNKDLGS